MWSVRGAVDVLKIRKHSAFMKPTPMSVESYLGVINTLIPKGWMPIGQFGSMAFRKSGKNYDLSAADLDQLERIERDQLFLIR